MSKIKNKIAWPKNEAPGFMHLYDANVKLARNLLRWGHRCAVIHGKDKRYPVCAGEHTKALCEYQGRTPDAAEKKRIAAGRQRRTELEG